MFLAHCMESQRPLDPPVWVNPGIRVLTFLREDCGYSPRKSYKKLFEDLGKPHVSCWTFLNPTSCSLSLKPKLYPWPDLLQGWRPFCYSSRSWSLHRMESPLPGLAVEFSHLQNLQSMLGTISCFLGPSSFGYLIFWLVCELPKHGCGIFLTCQWLASTGPLC